MPSRSPFHLALVPALVLSASVMRASLVTQTENAAASQSWNTASLWGGNEVIFDNTYVTSPAVNGAAFVLTHLGPGVRSRVRTHASNSSTSSNSTFEGGRLTIVTDTELLVKGTAGAAATVDLILKGGLVRLSSEGRPPFNATLAGTLDVVEDSIIGITQTGAANFLVSSTLTGRAVLKVRSGSSSGGPNEIRTVIFDGDLSIFSGTIQIGGSGDGLRSTTVILEAKYADKSFALEMGVPGNTTTDVLGLANTVTVRSFVFGGQAAGAGVYDVARLNTLFGNGNQFTGPGRLIVAPD